MNMPDHDRAADDEGLFPGRHIEPHFQNEARKRPATRSTTERRRGASGGKAALRSDMVHHGAADGVAVGGSVELGDDAAARHHADAVGDAEHFVEVLADQHAPRRRHRGRRAAAGCTAAQARTSSPRVGLWATMIEGSRLSSRARISFWALPPDRSAGPLRQAAHALHLEFGDRRFGRAPHGRRDRSRASDPNRPSWMKPIAKLSTIESEEARPND